MKHLLRLAFVLGIFCVVAPAIDAPWVYTAKLMKITIGAGRCFKVDIPDNANRIPVRACSVEAGQALLFASKDPGELRVTDQNGYAIKAVPDSDTPKTLDFVEEQLELLFRDNPLFVKIHRCGMKGERLVIELEPEVLQVKVDNVFDPYGHSTFLAQDLVSQLLKRKLFDRFEICTTTTPLRRPRH